MQRNTIKSFFKVETYKSMKNFLKNLKISRFVKDIK